MTGHGHSIVRNESAAVSAEVRSVNNRFLKTTILGEISAEMQALVEDIIRAQVKRGTVTIRIRLERRDPDQFKLNELALRSYLDQLRQWNQGEVSLATVLGLPGVVVEPDRESGCEELSELLRNAVNQSLAQMHAMREREGSAMRANLQDNLSYFRGMLNQVEQLAPRVVDNYAQRIRDRISQLLQKYDLTAQPADIIREVGIFAERMDIAEEIVRLKSHLQQFERTMDEAESNGRKLDFVIQEFLRETNTIGSKAADAQIANCVVEMKTIIERIREMVQNIE